MRQLTLDEFEHINNQHLINLFSDYISTLSIVTHDFPDYHILTFAELTNSIYNLPEQLRSQALYEHIIWEQPRVSIYSKLKSWWLN